MPEQGRLLARGPWTPEKIESVWREDVWEPPAELERQADAAVQGLRDRGSPAHDGEAARLAAWREDGDSLLLELQPVRWALRLIDAVEANSLTAMCVVRTEDGRWLAGRRAGWLATWPNRWALGAGGAVEVGENPALTLSRELEEEWQLVPGELSVQALAELPSGLMAVVGLATVPDDAQPIPDAEHDEFAWWPADVSRWPSDVDERLRRMGQMIAAGA
ncbi:MAG: 8-oxo-dGTP diphosphatase [Thermoleophilaceae bacterium]|jgi:8-oxo-dGTP diphosphatase|nr:8-oxo-dGTP diphosphatase [Thermoleophilaceae bacterium]